MYISPLTHCDEHTQPSKCRTPNAAAQMKTVQFDYGLPHTLFLFH